jgi:hypothetical protein
MWQAISTAPFDSDLELAVIDGVVHMHKYFHPAAFSAAGSTQKPNSGSKCILHTGAYGSQAEPRLLTGAVASAANFGAT